MTGVTSLGADYSCTALVLGAASVTAASFLGGITGFGYALVATPLLLLSGFPLPLVVSVNLSLALITRVSVAIRFRDDVTPQRVGPLVLGSVPGTWLGVRVLTSVDPGAIQTTAGVLVMALAIVVGTSTPARASRCVPGAYFAVGSAGGFLSSTTALSGVPPVLLLTRDAVPPRAVIGDLALYLVVANAIALSMLAADRAIPISGTVAVTMLWLPAALLGNLAGVSLGPRLPAWAFRRLTVALVFVAGALTAIFA